MSVRELTKAKGKGRRSGASYRCRPSAARGARDCANPVSSSAQPTLDAEPLRVAILQIQSSIIIVAVASPG